MSHEFDLTQLYASFREAENDLSNLCSLIQALEEMRGKLRRELERAILLMQKIAEIHDKLVCFSDLVASTNALSPEVLLDVRELQHGTSVQSEIASSFWREEVSRLDAEILKSSRSPVVRAHACFLSKHCNTAHRLPRKVEQMIEKVEPLGAMAWTEYLDHILDELQFVHPSDNEEMLGFDEMFELLTLVQTHKVANIPVVLYGKEYWQGLFDWLNGPVAEHGMISTIDPKLVTVTDDADEAVDVAVSAIVR